MSINDEDNSVTLNNGAVIQLHSKPQSLANTTGWVTWNAAIVVIRYLESNFSEVKNLRVADLSSGNALVALATAHLGASSVMATEVPACSALTRVNVEGNPQVKDIIQVEDYCWGDDVCPIRDCDVVIGSDLLFIAIRDSIYDELYKTLVDICTTNKKVFFCYEQRIIDKERAFMIRLETDLLVSKIPEQELDVGIDPTNIFFVPPNIQMYILTAK